MALVDEEGGASARLFTAGLDGTIVEVDVEASRPAAATDSYGGAVWAMAPEPRAALADGERRAACLPGYSACTRC